MLARRLPRFRRHRYRSAVRMNEVQPPRRLDSALARGGAEFAKNRGYVMDVIRKAGRRPRSERWSRTLRARRHADCCRARAKETWAAAQCTPICSSPVV